MTSVYIDPGKRRIFDVQDEIRRHADRDLIAGTGWNLRHGVVVVALRDGADPRDAIDHLDGLGFLAYQRIGQPTRTRRLPLDPREWFGSGV